MNQGQSMLIEGLVTTKHVANAALIKIASHTVLATTPAFGIQNQVPDIIQAFQSDLLQVRKDGLNFKGRRYKSLRADEDSIYLKAHNDGLILVKTKTLIVVGTFTQGMYPSVCVEAVEKMADYFRAKGN